MGSQPRHTTDSSGLLTVTIPGILVLGDTNKTSVWSSNTPTSASNPAAQLSDSEWEEKQRIFSSRPQPQPAKTSFANLDIRAGGSGCSRTFNGNGQDIYIRLAASEPDNAKSKVKKTRIVVTSTVLSAGLLILGLALLLRFQRKKHQQDGKPRSDQREDLELPLFDLSTVICATNDFSNHNKVGEGGFGSVYKGTLMDGQEIAAKSLLKHSRQGLNRLKNEVTHIAKLQHWNLTLAWQEVLEEMKLQQRQIKCGYMSPEYAIDGFYLIKSDMYSFGVMVLEIVKGKETEDFLIQTTALTCMDILSTVFSNVYCSMKLYSFYFFLFITFRLIDFLSTKISFVDHEDDAKINAKYSESNAKKMKIIISTTVLSTGLLLLGLALLFFVWKKQHQKVGKLGRNQKEDLELPLFDLMTIVSATSNFSIENKLGEGGFGSVFKAWMLHTEGRPLELLDTSVEDSITLFEVVRTIHVGLLCVQRNPEDRPSMSAAVLMLSGEGALPQPLKPGFYSERDLTELEASHSSKACSANEVTISVLEAR
ncbi:unnamed protein product [Malus baccata var. baccata]